MTASEQIYTDADTGLLEALRLAIPDLVAAAGHVKDGANVNLTVKGAFFQAPLIHDIVVNNPLSSLQFLLDQQVLNINGVDKDGRNVLQWLIYCDPKNDLYEKAVLLIDAGVSLDHKDKKDRSLQRYFDRANSNKDNFNNSLDVYQKIKEKVLDRQHQDAIIAVVEKTQTMTVFIRPRKFVPIKKNGGFSP